MWISSMLRDGHDGSISSKRVITFIAFLLCALAFIMNLFLGYKIEEFIFQSMSYIAMTGLGVTVAEKFSSRPTQVQSRQFPQSGFAQPFTPTTLPRRGTPLPYQEDPQL